MRKMQISETRGLRLNPMEIYSSTIDKLAGFLTRSAFRDFHMRSIP